MKRIITIGILFGCAFIVLFSVRLGVFRGFIKGPSRLSAMENRQKRDRETWMNIFQGDRKIGYSHSTSAPVEKGVLLTEDVMMKVDTMGVAQEIRLKTEAALANDFTLSSFTFSIDSGRFQFEASGHVTDETLMVKTGSGESQRQFSIKLEEKPFLSAGIYEAVRAAGLSPGDSLVFEIFDPSTMSREPVEVRAEKKESIHVMKTDMPALKLNLKYRNATTTSWLGENGDLLMEKGLLGLRLEKTTKEQALFGIPMEASSDLTKVASILTDRKIAQPRHLSRLKVEIGGIDLSSYNLSGGRQSLRDGILTIERETLSGTVKSSSEDFNPEDLAPTAFIQSDHPEIKQLAEKISRKDDPLPQKAMKIIHWIYKNIEKRPVISMPDALTTLKNRQGDCNEHAMLTAAIARASGIPAKVEAGIVYLNGRFYYHAWNALFLGKWITVDATFGQIPSDATHIRFASGPAELGNISGLIGKIRIHVLDAKGETQNIPKGST